MALLEINDLNIEVVTGSGVLHAVRGIDLAVNAGETLCIVGESGCGKSLMALSITGLLPPVARCSATRLAFEGHDIQHLSRRELEDLRGKGIGFIFQDPMTGLNPTMTIGRQLMEVHLRHVGRDREAAKTAAVSFLTRVGIANAATRLRQYPHELSGGLRQRVMIAMALMAHPRLIIADEPTTALDVTIQAQVLSLLKSLQREHGIGLVFITHDLGVVAAIADRVAVMYAGEVVETGDARDVLADPRHPYTRALISCVPSTTPSPAGVSVELGTISGRVPLLHGRIEGCAFAPRCALVRDRCSTETVPARPAGAVEICRCLFAIEKREFFHA
ncbi:ABC transporter ATP-binding protein [Sinorhizobium medicae]|uniref:ABC transporter ATP-binding protein n=1 Tax=Sinorhizobium medicae TaxID=110321 RepID=UPI000FD74A1D|nr:ABC transporter ATP-binding protein [Sinorhizobium medicae]RVJ44116.1 ABC transporter ATP-binding protein [Sinorhizobium medicae]